MGLGTGLAMAPAIYLVSSEVWKKKEEHLPSKQTDIVPNGYAYYRAYSIMVPISEHS